jgi:hypothetical protein
MASNIMIENPEQAIASLTKSNIVNGKNKLKFPHPEM